MKNVIFSFVSILSLLSLSAQQGVIKGRVVDSQSEIPLIGANVILENSDPVMGGVTDLDGYFRIGNVPVGRQSIAISFLGYEPEVIPNLVVTAGKELDLDVNLTESFQSLGTVTISAQTDKDKANNEMAMMSARQFSLEEVRRYSGGRGDVARLASNFAGVATADDSRNDIVIRGNSPTGLLWRIDGIPVPNPNHFSTFGTTGGPVSALNPNMMKNSDFLTSAFPAEYGNALAGVFDIGFRNGNKDKAEYSFQAGAFSGLEATAEGGLGKNNGSYLLAGRYSLVGLIGGAAGTAATPIYSDLSVKLDLGRTKLGRFELFGIYGVSNIDFIGAEIDSTDLFASVDEDSFYKGFVGMGGLTHTLLLNDKSYLKTTIGGSLNGSTFSVERYLDQGTEDERKVDYTEVENGENRMTFNSRFNSKLNNRTTLRTGVLAEYISNNAALMDREDQADMDGDGLQDLVTLYDIDGSYSIMQPYAQAMHRLGSRWQTNVGVHGQYFGLNGDFQVEPRLSVQYDINEKHNVKIGYGIHHQATPGPILFLTHFENGQSFQRNEELAMTRSQHFVLGYDVRVAKNWRAKAEVYYQYIDKAPVERLPSSYSALSEGAGFGFSTSRTDLVNEGTGFNQGLELTVEKFFSEHYYVLMTTSIFEAKYTGGDGVERNSPFNNQYVFNLLAGKEFPLDDKGKKLLFMDTKFTRAGGRFYTPIDLAASQAAGAEVLIEEEAFSQQIESYMRWDVKIGARFNSPDKKLAHQFYFDFQNILDADNVFLQRYNRQTNEINTVYQQGFFPDFGYRIQF